MRALTAEEVRASFVNGTRGERRRVVLPDLKDVPWDDLDFLGWPDPSGAPRACLVLDRPHGPVGLLLNRPPRPAGAARRNALCQVCLTPHSSHDVALSVAPRTGEAGRRGDSTGLYLCRDLACSLYVRGRRVSGTPRLHETLSVEERVARCRRNLDEFVDRVLGPPPGPP